MIAWLECRVLPNKFEVEIKDTLGLTHVLLGVPDYNLKIDYLRLDTYLKVEVLEIQDNWILVELPSETTNNLRILSVFGTNLYQDWGTNAIALLQGRV